MTETQTAAHQLAQAIAGFRVQEKAARQSLIVLGCNLRNIARQFGLYRLADAMQD